MEFSEIFMIAFYFILSVLIILWVPYIIYKQIKDDIIVNIRDYIDDNYCVQWYGILTFTVNILYFIVITSITFFFLLLIMYENSPTFNELITISTIVWIFSTALKYFERKKMG